MFFNLGSGKIVTSVKGRANSGVMYVADSNIFFDGCFSYSISPNKDQFYAFVSCLRQAARSASEQQIVEKSGELSFFTEGPDVEGYCNVTISCESWFCINMKHKYLESFADFLMEYQSRFLD